MSWDPYLDLQSGVLRNRLSITDAAELAHAEAELTSYRLIELHAHRLPVRYDLAHLQAFHRHIFGDVYDWAGQLRTVSIGKGALFCPPQDLVASADEVFTRLARDQHLQGRDRAGFIDGLTALRTSTRCTPSGKATAGPSGRSSRSWPATRDTASAGPTWTRRPTSPPRPPRTATATRRCYARC